MKNICLILLCFLLFSFGAERSFSLKFKEGELNQHFKNLNTIKEIANTSNLPHQQVLFILTSIDSLQQSIRTQVLPQMRDSSSKK